MSLLIALLLTVLIEGIVVLCLTRSFEWVKFNLYCNLVTNPLLNIVLWVLLPALRVSTGIGVMVAGEIIVVLTETLLYKFMTKAHWNHCALVSLISNLISVLVGVAFSNIQL